LAYRVDVSTSKVPDNKVAKVHEPLAAMVRRKS
jgi:hypothetical protein